MLPWRVTTVLFAALLGTTISLHRVFAQDLKKPQMEKKGGQQQREFAIRIPVNVVVVHATVTDGQKRPVRDLSAEEFRLFEDGKRQPLQTFALECYEAPQRTQIPARPAVNEPSTAREPGAPHLSRFISLVVDDLTVAEPQLIHSSIEAMRKYVAEDLSSDDRVSISSVSGQVASEFTSDTALMNKHLAEIERKAIRINPHRSSCPTLTDLQAQNIALEREDGVSVQVAMADMAQCDPYPMLPMLRFAARNQYNDARYNTRLLLMQLRQYVRSLTHIVGRKLLILSSGGFLSDDFRYELQDLVDSSLRSGVVVSTLNARGLTSGIRQAAERATGSPQAESGRFMLQSFTKLAMEAPLVQLAADTGGLSFLDNNDLHAGLKAAVTQQSCHYVLSYVAPNSKYDGSFHGIRLEVVRPSVNVSYRKGYYAPKEQLSFERRTKEDILDALRAPADLNEIPIQLSYSHSQI
ncbi:MAG TPA: VWA domain-containing protein, partial [Acidobacteriota bacterium]|nr:VWA domain-containing protein [Acidobacteriota bacterium]